MKGTVSLVRVYTLFCNNKTSSAILCTCSNSATFFFKVFRSCHSLLDAQNPCLDRSSAHKYIGPNPNADKINYYDFRFRGFSIPWRTGV